MSDNTSPAAYGRRGTKSADLRGAVHELLRSHEAAGELPTSNRFLYYELVQAGVLDKSKTRQRGRGADQDLADASKWLRDKGIVPWNWIVDETRTATTYLYAPTVAAYVKGSVDRARLDCWEGALPPLLLCESRTFGGVLERGIARDYLCAVAATNGQVGGFLHTNIVPLLDGGDRRVLYVGDLDHQGAQIERNTRRVLQSAVGPLDWTRVALLAEQAVGLPTVTKLDRRYKPPRAHNAVEVEALGQSTVIGLVRAALEVLLPEPLDHVLVREQAQREQVARLLAEMNAR
jgi:hypothetical protein